MADLSERNKPVYTKRGPIWVAPFRRGEWALEWAIYFFEGIAIFKFLEYMGKLTILFGVILYFFEIPERRRKADDEKKRAQYEAWLIINSAKGEGGDGGRRLAIRDLHRDGVSLLGLTAEESFLDGIDLNGADLRRAKLRWADLQNSHLGQSNLKNADLRNVDLRNADLRGAILVGADLRNARFQGADLSGADLSEADVTGAILQGAKGLQPGSLRVASHYDAAILDADFGRVEGFDPMDLGGLNFSKYDFRYANLAGRRLGGANLEACNLNHVDLSGADLGEANLTYASLRGANLSGANLEKAILSNLNLPLPPWLDSKASPTAAVAPSPQMGSPPVGVASRPEGGRKVTNFRGAKLRGVVFDNANLEDADFADADLTGAKFFSSDLRGADFRGANVERARLDLSINLTEGQIRLAKNWEKAVFPLHLGVKLGLRKPPKGLNNSINFSMVPSKSVPMPEPPADDAEWPAAPPAPAVPRPAPAPPPVPTEPTTALPHKSPA